MLLFIHHILQPGNAVALIGLVRCLTLFCFSFVVFVKSQCLKVKGNYLSDRIGVIINKNHITCLNNDFLLMQGHAC